MQKCPTSKHGESVGVFSINTAFVIKYKVFVSFKTRVGKPWEKGLTMLGIFVALFRRRNIFHLFFSLYLLSRNLAIRYLGILGM